MTIAHMYKTYTGSPGSIAFHVDRALFPEVQREEYYSFLFHLESINTDLSTVSVIESKLVIEKYDINITFFYYFSGDVLEPLLQVQTTAAKKGKIFTTICLQILYLELLNPCHIE